MEVVRLQSHAAALMLLLAFAAPACGGQEPTSPTSSLPASPSPAPSAPSVLLPNGIGDLGFGDPVGEVLPLLIQRFGEPGEVRSAHDPDLWGYLALAPGIDGRIRLVSWGPLTAIFLDRSGTIPAAALPFEAWSMNASGGTDPPLTTEEGIGLGSTRADLEAAYGTQLTLPSEPGGPCGISWVFTAETRDGSYHGTFEGEPVSPEVPVTSIGAGIEPSC